MDGMGFIQIIFSTKLPRFAPLKIRGHWPSARIALKSVPTGFLLANKGVAKKNWQFPVDWKKCFWTLQRWLSPWFCCLTCIAYKPIKPTWTKFPQNIPHIVIWRQIIIHHFRKEQKQTTNKSQEHLQIQKKMVHAQSLTFRPKKETTISFQGKDHLSVPSNFRRELLVLGNI